MCKHSYLAQLRVAVTASTWHTLADVTQPRVMRHGGKQELIWQENECDKLIVRVKEMQCNKANGVQVTFDIICECEHERRIDILH
ncbi:hypothetical protein EDC04DRAFT_157205 [Pisolithus marmoratus]|nr:hypothetical protein EDC04DRAFT_157205 [Pisolithus marmoratus]